jgi:tartrate dehydratase alpha subunit/fumarate hydratase class I-like protein
MCAEGHRPICQDTGIVNVFLKVGMDVRWGLPGSLEDAVNEGVRRAYLTPTTRCAPRCWPTRRSSARTPRTTRRPWST